jgi:hypothetical protein
MRLRSLTIQGFRAFGATPQTINCNGPLTVVFGNNSQGKSSLVEAIEFLLTGHTSRARLHPTKAEFADCLRNVHLPPGEEAFVEGVIEVHGRARRLRRVLVTDIGPSGTCSTILTADDEPVGDVSSCGISLASPPFESPVLMHHSLRYVLAAGPQSRTDYLKAVLDVADLDEVRRIITEQIDSFSPPVTPALDRWDGARARAELAGPLGRATVHSIASLENSLSEAIALLSGVRTDSGFPALVDQFRSELSHRRASIFSSEAFVATPLAWAEWPAFDALGELSRNATASPGDRALLPLLEAVLRLPSLQTAIRHVDCPVCLTRDALDERRIRAIREFIDARAKESGLLERFSAEIASAKTAGKRLRDGLAKARAPALSWTEDERLRHSEASRSLLSEEGATAFDELQAALQRIVEYWDAASRALDLAAVAIKGAEDGVREGRAVDVDGLRRSTASVKEHVSTLSRVVDAYIEAAAPPLARLRAEIATLSNTSGWDELLGLCLSHTFIPTEAQERETFQRFQKDAGSALKQIDKARGAVLDANFESLSKDVSSWWNLLRPDEAVRFSGVRRRGAGLRYVVVPPL